MKYRIGEKITLDNGKIGTIEDARKNIIGEEYDVKVGEEIISFSIEDEKD